MLLHVNTVQLIKVREMCVLLVNSAECDSVVNCTLSGIRNDDTQKESGSNELLFSYHFTKWLRDNKY